MSVTSYHTHATTSASIFVSPVANPATNPAATLTGTHTITPATSPPAIPSTTPAPGRRTYSKRSQKAGTNRFSRPSQDFSRLVNLERMAEEHFDVVVIGGGITGVGCALDAASRGLSVALIEKDDFASGTSSKSSKLVHGGLRYLQQRRVVLVYEALAERQRLLRNAAHLVRVLPFVIPMLSEDGFINPKAARALGVAMWAYDLTGGLRIGKKHKRISATEALELFPTLPQERLEHGYIYYDCETDDARLTLAVARTAALDFGAAIANRVKASSIHLDSAGRCRGVETQTAEGDKLVIRSSTVINAAGVWADEVRQLNEPESVSRLRPAKGIHIALPRSAFQNTAAAVVPVPRDNRSIFIIPWEKVTYLGTTDTDYSGNINTPDCDRDDVEYLLETARATTSVQATGSDILSVWAGLRPLVQGSTNASTADLSRRHSVTSTASGVVTVVGGKLTTYRKMASDAVDEALQFLDAESGVSRTLNLPLRGSPEETSDTGVTQWLDVLRSQKPTGDLAAGNLPIGNLPGRYGTESAEVQKLIDSQPELGELLHPELPYCKAEVLYAAKYEMATTLDDILSRRTRSRLQNAFASAEVAQQVAELVAPELGWHKERITQEVASYTESVKQEMSTWLN